MDLLINGVRDAEYFFLIFFTSVEIKREIFCIYERSRDVFFLRCFFFFSIYLSLHLCFTFILTFPIQKIPVSFLSTYLFILHPVICLPVYLFICLNASLPTFHPVYLSVFLSIQLPVENLSTHLYFPTCLNLHNLYN